MGEKRKSYSCGPMLVFRVVFFLRFESTKNLTDGLPSKKDENQIGPHLSQISEQQL
ncbi:hypothetical protein EXN66_Car021926 [Channa argus]|uniref:Uncharacterized protein n=1 Tax=Channa argus TaxID=215402 RepID=A0A6G1QUR6_CHAAH|nr:hypothetical protein EXN66_Car021926 [Channa argus]